MKGMKSAATDAALSDLQLQVMQALWKRGEASASDVQQSLAAAHRPLALTTVSTLLTRLAKRGLLETRRDGRQVFFRSRVSEREVKRGMVANLLGSLFAGDPRALVAHLVKESELAPGDLEALGELLDSELQDNKGKGR